MGYCEERVVDMGCISEGRNMTRLECETIEVTNEWWEAKLQVGYLNSSYFKFNSYIKFFILLILKL